MKATLLIHVEPSEDEIVWWAESTDLPGFSAAAESLADLRVSARAAISAEWDDEVEIVEELVGEEQPRSESGERLTTAVVMA